MILFLICTFSVCVIKAKMGCKMAPESKSSNWHWVMLWLYFDMAVCMFFRRNSNRKTHFLFFKPEHISSANAFIWAPFCGGGGSKQPLALIITTTTCHSSHHNTVRAVPVTVWEDGWEEMCLYCNLAQRVCAVWPRPEIFFGMLSSIFLSIFYFFPPPPTSLSLSLFSSLSPPNLPPSMTLFRHQWQKRQTGSL